MFDFLKQIPLFSGLSKKDLALLCKITEEVRISAGELLFSEGDMGDQAYIIMEGQIEILKTVAGREVLLAVRGKGEVIGEMSLLEAVPRNATGKARTDSVLVVISHEELDNLLSASSTAARTLLHTVTARLKSTELMLQQSEKMAQLGLLTAGIAHEINNPVAAVQRGAGQLKTALDRWQQAQILFGRLDLSEEQWGLIQEWVQNTGGNASVRKDWDPLERSDQESELADWLDEQGIEDGWDLAPALINMGYGRSDLETLAENFETDQLKVVLSWLAARAGIDSLVDEIRLGAGRVSDIVKALKSYVYLDQGPTQRVDVHEGLENTLIILRSKTGDDILLRREYGEGVPAIDAYGSELNQVWTNIIANAAEAMEGRGEITLRTRRENGWVVVEISDTGPGIPDDILPNIFNPFFTTKPVGQGTGLGLNISYNIIKKHGGEIRVFSRPGKTCFQVLLPVDQEASTSGAPILETISEPE